ncbi:uncharacterized protein LOC143299909 [Babylonia areolata]|uniref:uncharacterized protein LOC143299909 n=1 Tax=Babylonia areolata TaxID=304850 RepID=UPI003FD2320C
MTNGGEGRAMRSSHALGALSSCRWQLLDCLPSCAGEDGRGGAQTGGGGGGGSIPQGLRSRHRHSACCVGDHVYIFGGKEGTSSRKDVWRFHVDSYRWEAVDLGGAGLPFLQGHTSVAYKKVVFIFGGTFSDSVGDVQLWTFDTGSGQVEEVRFQPGAAQPSCRRDHSAVLHNTTMYIYGGFVSSRGANQELWAFNIEEMAWREYRALSPAWPGCRYGHTTVVADNALWLFGGMAGLVPKADLWRYSFLLHQWKKVKALGSPPCLSGHTASVVGRYMVVVGGKSQRKPVSEVWCFSFDTSTWQQVSQQGGLLPCLSFHTCVSYHQTCPAPDDSMNGVSGSPTLKSAARCPQGTASKTSSPGGSEEKSQKSSHASQCGNEAEVRVSEDSETINSTNIIDTRIHVSAKEALLISPASLETTRSSLGALFRRSPGYVQLEEDFELESLSPHSDHSVLTERSSHQKNTPEQTFLQTLSPHHDSQKPVTESQKSVPDLIDLSHSPAVTVPALDKGFLFGELDAFSLKSLDEFSMTKEVGVSPGDSMLCVQSQWVCPQTVSFSDLCDPDHWHSNLKMDPKSDSPQSTVEHCQRQPSPGSVTGIDVQELKCAEVKMGQERTERQSLSFSLQPVKKEWCEFFTPPTARAADSWETDSSATEDGTDDGVLLIRSEADVKAESKVRPDAGVSRSRNNSVNTPRTAGEKMDRYSVMGRREKGREGVVWSVTDAGLDGQFLLVLGGQTEQLGAGLSNPMSVWKGVLL